MRILIAEDDVSVARALADVLRHHGHTTQHVVSGDEVLHAHRGQDMVLLDLQLFESDGYTTLRRLRQVSQVPVVVITARGDERSTVRALHLGADDYLVKPVRMNELIARLQSVARRRQPQREAQTVVCGDVEIDLVARVVSLAGLPVALTTKEFELLAVLARHAGQAVRRQQILDEVWGDAFMNTSRSIDVHLTQLRVKLGRPELITTIRGFGYRLETDP